jgi:phosphodiesterase/alkaline phosphatase D-like protein
LTKSYGSKIPLLAASPLGSDVSAEHVFADLTGLAPSTKYHYRIVAESGAEIVLGKDRTFKTS